MAESEMRADSPPPAAPEALQRAQTAFAAGDYARVREALGAFEQADSAELRARAAQLARAVSVDPALLAVLLGCLVGFGSVFVHYVLR